MLWIKGFGIFLSVLGLKVCDLAKGLGFWLKVWGFGIWPRVLGFGFGFGV